MISSKDDTAQAETGRCITGPARGRRAIPAFDDLVLDPDRRELTRGAETIAIGPQVFDLLLHLVRNREHVVTKDNLIDVVWGGRIVSESTLTSHINAVRKAIGDTGDEQRLVRTIARKGYRFVGDVRETAASGKCGVPPSPMSDRRLAAFRIGHPSPSCRS